ncbi:hypothetical protein [Actinoallomurus sp. CA-142502]|uniref:hypothetical protein n=1 Tax=Actinoallomurus sp. CA-142502 TaxID=3239885 RepID=UPI003D91D08D
MTASAADRPAPAHLVRESDALRREFEELKANPDRTLDQLDDLLERIEKLHARALALKPCGCGTTNEPDRAACWRCGDPL